MNERIRELRLDAGIARIENQKWLCVLDKESGMMIDPMIGIEKFAALIVQQCAEIADRCAENGSWMAGYRMKQHFGVTNEQTSKTD